MDQLWELRYLFETSPIALIATAVVVVVVSSYRALLHEIETEKKTEGNDEFVTLDGSQAILIPIVSSISLVVMFYAFAAISQIFAMFCAIICVSSMVFCFSPLAHRIASFIKCRYSKENAVEGKVSLVVISVGVVFLWMVSGHWLLNNLLGTTLCIAFVSHVRLRNLRICSILLISLFFYDIFWVFFSEYFFGANVMVTVASQKAVNPVHTVASHLHLAKSVARKIDLPVKLLIPRNILGSVFSGEVDPREFLMLGLGDMVCFPFNSTLYLFDPIFPSELLHFSTQFSLYSPVELIQD